MNRLNDGILYEKYPFTDSIYFECDDGWFRILDNLFNEISPYTTEDNEFIVLQVKEKYGQLRVYVSPYIQEVEDIIDVYEKISLGTCEACGIEGKLVGKNHFKVLCKEHETQWKL